MKLNRVWFVYIFLAAVIVLAVPYQQSKPPKSNTILWELDPTVSLRVETTPITDEKSMTIVTPISEQQSTDALKIDKRVDGIWKPIPYEPRSHFANVFISPLDRKTINITGLDSGFYRVWRNVNTNEAMNASIEFTIVRPEQAPDTQPIYGFRPIYFYENWRNGLQTLELANLGARTLLIGSGYELEKKTDLGWVTVASVADAGPPLEVESWGIYRQGFQLPLGEGEYRYAKKVGVEGSNLVEKLTFPYIEPASDMKTYIWDPEPNLRSGEFSANINVGPYAPGDAVPFRVQHLGGSGEDNKVSFKLELIKATNLETVSHGAILPLGTYMSWETTIDIPPESDTGIYYLKLSAYFGEGIFSTITRVVQVVKYDDLPISPEVRVDADPPHGRSFFFTVTNGSPRNMVMNYTLERWVDLGWLSYHLNSAAKNEGVDIRTGAFWWQRFDLSGAEAGKYRVVALIKYPDGEPQVFYVEFQVE